ncbi:hypothetical protein PSTG_01603 [Puccinia striiformis f. sp. tritici PST-78]|uniref:Uncharacterized protein n=1 Tax=Puccinia striiformis f. sp. tritici PST-78 TaxID=1165861 RepID=A0A0L0W293_9BASI|nr:hypothetical protein PSTG_01603 [Puccinia striiformis f. sp. tritici PST-78]
MAGRYRHTYLCRVAKHRKYDTWWVFRIGKGILLPYYDNDNTWRGAWNVSVWYWLLGFVVKAISMTLFGQRFSDAATDILTRRYFWLGTSDVVVYRAVSQSNYESPADDNPWKNAITFYFIVTAKRYWNIT